MAEEIGYRFYKYQAAGNDFIIFDGRQQEIPRDPAFLSVLCDRRFGIGADGVIIIKESADSDYEVIYLNPDGSLSLCGNGTRSAIRFARKLGLFTTNETRFRAYDGLHEASILPDGNIRLKMNDVHSVRFLEDGIFLDTGSPHLVRFTEDLENEDVFKVGRKLRYETPVENGTNVNFVQILAPDRLKIRTYERGVEQETLSCGTGVTASALAALYKGGKNKVMLEARGGTLEVEYTHDGENHFKDIYLTGPAEEVFEGLYIYRK